MRGGRDLLLTFGAALVVIAALGAVALLRWPSGPPPPRLDPVAAQLLAFHGVTVSAPDDPVLPAPIATARRYGLPAVVAEPFISYRPATPKPSRIPIAVLGPVNRAGGGGGTEVSRTLAYLGGTGKSVGGGKVLGWIVVSRQPRVDRAVETVTLIDADSGHLLGRFTTALTPSG